MYLNFLIIGAQIVTLQKSLEYFKSIITAKTSSDEYIANPSIIFNLNLAYLLTSFTTVEMTTRWTAFGILIPATKPLILVAGTRGFSIQSFQQFRKIMKAGENIDISRAVEDTYQILIVDDKEILRFARVDEGIKLHCRASAYGHVFANIVEIIIEKETSILNQVQELSTLNSDRSNENIRRNRNVLHFFTGRSAGDRHIFTHHSAQIIIMIRGKYSMNLTR